MRSASPALVLVFALAMTCATHASACTIMPEIEPGITLEQSFMLSDRRDQIVAWDDATSVYLARVSSIKSRGDGGEVQTFQPITRITGDHPPGRASHTWFGDGCHGHRWQKGDVVVVYARRGRLSDGLTRWGRWSVLLSTSPSRAYDPRVVAGLRSAQP